MKKISKKSLLLLIALALILTVSAGVTVAYLAAATEPVVNVFKPAAVTTEIVEEFIGTEKKNVRVSNTGDVAVYVRAKVVANWCDADGNVVAPWVDDISYNPAWTEGDDGYYYHNTRIDKGSASANLFDSYSYKTSNIPEGAHHLEMTIIHQSVQAEPDKTPITELWGAAAEKLVQ